MSLKHLGSSLLPRPPQVDEASGSVVDDLSALVRQLAHRLGKAAPDSDLPARALDYLKRKGLQGSPLRNAGDQISRQAQLARWEEGHTRDR